MRKLFQHIEAVLKANCPAVFVMVVASSGSTPRGAGACMLITEQGRVYGTIGGGAVEHQCENIARTILKTRKSQLTVYRLHENEIQDLGMICGGEVQVYFRFLAANDAQIITVCDAVKEICENNIDSWLIVDITAENDGDMAVFSSNRRLVGADVPSAVTEQLVRKPIQISCDGHDYSCQPLTQGGRVYIFGGGHVAQALIPVLDTVGFSCVLLEDRIDFCNKTLFPNAVQTKLVDNACILDSLHITKDDFVVIMTRGHKDDQTIQAQVLKTPARYIGVIGSSRKKTAVFENLRKLGFDDTDLSRITTPIGLDIGAETPAEIAISIAAQLIAERARDNEK